MLMVTHTYILCTCIIDNYISMDSALINYNIRQMLLCVIQLQIRAGNSLDRFVRTEKFKIIN